MYDDRAPQDKIANDYKIRYREGGGERDYPFSHARSIDRTMSFMAYVINRNTERVSKNTIHYYIIESESAASGSVYIESPYDASRISAAVLSEGEYARGIRLLTQNNTATIHYFCSYTLKGEEGSITTSHMQYDDIPIAVNPLMTSMTITAWLQDLSGKIEDSEFVHTIEFVHLNVPKTTLGDERVEFDKTTKYKFVNEYADDDEIFLYYTLDGSDPTDENNASRRVYDAEELTPNGAVVKAVYMSACGQCGERESDKRLCTNEIYGPVGEYRYTTKGNTVGGGGGGTTVIDNTRKYTTDIFGNEAAMHISYINGYPDGSVKPQGKITREEMTAVLYRITNHEYEKPFVTTGAVFDDISLDRWSALSIEYMAEKGVATGYPDGEFKPQGNLSRAEFAALICRFAGLDEAEGENPFSDLESSHWAYRNILALAKAGLVNGYDDGTEREITRA